MTTTRAEQIQALKEMGYTPDENEFSTPRSKRKHPAARETESEIVGGVIDTAAVYAKFNRRRNRDDED